MALTQPEGQNSSVNKAPEAKLTAGQRAVKKLQEIKGNVQAKLKNWSETPAQKAVREMTVGKQPTTLLEQQQQTNAAVIEGDRARQHSKLERQMTARNNTSELPLTAQEFYRTNNDRAVAASARQFVVENMQGATTGKTEPVSNQSSEFQQQSNAAVEGARARAVYREEVIVREQGKADKLEPEAINAKVEAMKRQKEPINENNAAEKKRDEAKNIKDLAVSILAESSDEGNPQGETRGQKAVRTVMDNMNGAGEVSKSTYIKNMQKSLDRSAARQQVDDIDEYVQVDRSGKEHTIRGREQTEITYNLSTNEGIITAIKYLKEAARRNRLTSTDKVVNYFVSRVVTIVGDDKKSALHAMAQLAGVQELADLGLLNDRFFKSINTQNYPMNNRTINVPITN